MKMFQFLMSHLFIIHLVYYHKQFPWFTCIFTLRSVDVVHLITRYTNTRKPATLREGDGLTRTHFETLLGLYCAG